MCTIQIQHLVENVVLQMHVTETDADHKVTNCYLSIINVQWEGNKLKHNKS